MKDWKRIRCVFSLVFVLSLCPLPVYSLICIFECNYFLKFISITVSKSIQYSGQVETVWQYFLQFYPHTRVILTMSSPCMQLMHTRVILTMSSPCMQLMHTRAILTTSSQCMQLMHTRAVLTTSSPCMQLTLFSTPLSFETF